MLDVRLVAVADLSAAAPVVLALPTAPAAEPDAAEPGADGPGPLVEADAADEAPGPVAVTDAEIAEATAEYADTAEDADAAEDGDVAERSEPATLLPTGYSLPDSLRATLDAWLGDERRPEPPAKGKAGEIATLPLPGGAPALVLLVGVGEGSEADWRKAGAALVRAASGDPEVVLALPSDATPDAVRGLFEGALLASYRFTLASDPKPQTLTTVTVVTDDPTQFSDAVARAEAVARGTAFARDLVNTPSNIKSPEWFAAQAVERATALGIDAQVRDPEWLAANDFGGMLAVGGGSTRGPRLLELRWAPQGVELHTLRHIVLVGKGITFDTGGISIKPAQGMQLMKKDMGGGAAVVGAVLAAAAQQLPLRVTVLVPLAENMPSGTAQRPSDVVVMRNGTSVEILDTDAEGRMVLGDGLCLASEKHPDWVVDIATLTGAQVVALGTDIAGVMANDDAFRSRVVDAAGAAGEGAWPMPLPVELRAKLDTPTADIAHKGDRDGGMLTAGLFLKEFVGEGIRWAHLDIAGPAFNDAPPHGYTPKGGTGHAVRTLVRLAEDLAAGDVPEA